MVTPDPGTGTVFSIPDTISRGQKSNGYRTCNTEKGKKVLCREGYFYCPSMNSHRPRSQNISKESTLNPEKDSSIKKTQIACKFGEIITKL